MITTKDTLSKVSEIIDIKMGFLGATFLASVVFWINFDHGYLASGIAAMKQFGYTFFFGGLFLKMAENIAITRRYRFNAIIMGATIPMLLTALLTLCLHSLKGTPEPVNSTLPTMFFATLSFGFWSWYKTRGK